jgi:hypothetical protein
MLQTADKVFDSFRGGRYTRSNLVRISDDHLLVANQIIFPGDGIAHKRPGYTKVTTLPFAATHVFDFQRQSDGAQFIIYSGAGKIGYTRADGSGYTELSSGEDATAPWSFATNTFGLYGSNGINKYRFIDTGNGLLTKRNWGIDAPALSPLFAFNVGTLTLTAGRQYAFSWVSKWTDSQGTQRVHVGPPSPLTGTTGPQLLEVINLSRLTASADAQVTHIWIWATNDTPLNTTSVLYFLAEVANGVTAYADSTPDTGLDTTRQIPYENFAPPAARIITEFQGRFGLSGITGKPDLVQGTGLEEINLGIPQETAPPSVFFNVPGGIKAISAMKVFNQALMLSTEQFWFQVTGFSAETFQENDNIFSPGAAGIDLICVTPTWMTWASRDKKVWAWNGSGEPIEVSWKIARADGSSQLSMESISDSQLANGQLRWYSFGRYSVLALFISTKNNTYFDWCQLWDVSVLSAPTGPMGSTTKDGMLMGAAEGDAFFSDHIIGSGNVLVGSTDYLFLTDTAGNVFRWPDGFTDNGQVYFPAMGSEFSDGDAPGLIKRNRFLDVLTNRIDAAQSFGADALATDGMNVQADPFALELIGPIPGSDRSAPDPTTFRAKLERKGSAVGRWLRWWIQFPGDDQDAEVYEVQWKFTIVGKDTR